jgi:hypothetical protein
MGIPKRKNDIEIYKGKELTERRQQLLDRITKSDSYLPDSILHDDLDGGMLDFVKENLKVVSDGSQIPVIPKILTIQRWGEISNNWNFNNSTNDKKLMIFNPTGQSRVIIPSQAGSFAAAWPQGWGGGLATFDITCASIYSNSVVLQSDMRLKNSVKDLDLSFVNKFMSLRPVNYYWNEGKSEDKGLQYGFIAQEVAQIFPELVFTASDEIQTKSMNYQAFHAMSARMIQLQQVQLKDQQQEINELKRSLESLDARLQSLEKK